MNRKLIALVFVSMLGLCLTVYAKPSTNAKSTNSKATYNTKGVPTYGRAIQTVAPVNGGLFQFYKSKTSAGDLDNGGCYKANFCQGKFSYSYLEKEVLTDKSFTLYYDTKNSIQN